MRTAPLKNDSLLIRIYSFSYLLDGVIRDITGNAGGFVFDCRGLPNPGRIDSYHDLSGFDEDVVKMLESATETSSFIEQAFRLVKSTSDNYTQRGFTDLYTAFGCTGGRHRSVYSANIMSQMLKDSGFKVQTVHWGLEKRDDRFRVRRAMILAAGIGKRLAPITGKIPKALVEAGDKTMLEWTLDALVKAGFSEITINVHHHPRQMMNFIDNYKNKAPSVKFNISYEPELLGTGGGVKKAARWLYGPSPVLIHNADIRTDFDLNIIYEKHNPQDTATLVCQNRTTTRYLLIDDSNAVRGRTDDNYQNSVKEDDLKKIAFSGIHICSSEFFERLAESDDFDILDCYMKMIELGASVKALRVVGRWFDMGTPEKLGRLREYLGGFS